MVSFDGDDNDVGGRDHVVSTQDTLESQSQSQSQSNNGHWLFKPPPNNNLSMDELLVKSFVDIVQRKYDEGKLSGPTRGSPEHELLTQALRPGFQWGIAAAAVQFVIL